MGAGGGGHSCPLQAADGALGDACVPPLPTGGGDHVPPAVGVPRQRGHRWGRYGPRSPRGG